VSEFLKNPVSWLETEILYHSYTTRGEAQEVANGIDRTGCKQLSRTEQNSWRATFAIEKSSSLRWMESTWCFTKQPTAVICPKISKFVAVNSLGTAQLLEIVREKNLAIRKIIVASSQVVYPEGAGECPQHGLVFPGLRPVEQLRRGDFSVRCPACQIPTKSVPTPEFAPLGGETVYAITKVDQEKLVLTWGRQVGIPTVALRYSCTFGPRQSIFNPYTGVIAIFCTRLLNNLPPVIYEDGEQTRDFSYVEDIARANLLAANSDQLDGKAVNVGSGRAVTIKRVTELISAALRIPLAPIMNREFRPGEMRHLISDTTVIRNAGYAPAVSLEEGIERYLEWIRQQGSIKDYFAAAELILRKKGILQKVDA